MTDGGVSLTIPIDQIDTQQNALRPVKKDSVKFLGIRDSIKNDGMLNAINVVPAVEADRVTVRKLPDGRPIYRLMDGAHRLAAAIDLGWKEVRCTVFQKTEVGVMIGQLAANSHKVETAPFQYAQQIQRILAEDRTMTLVQLAKATSQSVGWLNKILKLTELKPEIGKLVDDGKLTLINAITLVKLKDPEQQAEFLEYAKDDSVDVFTQKVEDQLAENRKAAREARDPAEAGKFRPTAHLRNRSEVEAELEKGTVLADLVKSSGLTDPVEVAKFALRWTLHLDAASLAEAKANFEAKKKKIADEKEKAKKERQEKAAAAPSA